MTSPQPPRLLRVTRATSRLRAGPKSFKNSCDIRKEKEAETSAQESRPVTATSVPGTSIQIPSEEESTSSRTLTLEKSGGEGRAQAEAEQLHIADSSDEESSVMSVDSLASASFAFKKMGPKALQLLAGQIPKRSKNPQPGEWSGIHEARRKMRKQALEEADFRLTTEVVSRLRSATTIYDKGEGTMADVPVDEITASITASVKAVEDVVKRSRNLKRTLMKSLKVAFVHIRTCMDELCIRA